MNTNSIDKLERMAIIGNAWSDQDLFTLAHEILTDDSPLDHKARAIIVLSHAVGVEEPTEAEMEQAIADYLRYARDDV